MKKFKYRDGIFLLVQDVVDTLESYKYNDLDFKESGGVLMGRYLKDSYNIVVDKVTIPLPSDTRSYSHYYRSEGHQDYIEREYYASDGTCNYIGEWHSHPCGINNHSSVDLKSWMNKLELNLDFFPEYPLFFIIVCEYKIRVWEGFKKIKIIKELEETIDL